MKKSIGVLSIALLAILFINLGAVKSQTFNPFLAAKLDSTLIAAVPSQVKGVSASIYVPGQGVWRGTYGISYAGHSITPDMEFGIASNTKLFTATAIMKLVEANKLNLNDHLGKWVKKKYNNIDSTISIKQLLYHTSGLSDNSLEFFDSARKFPSRVFTVDEILGWQDAKIATPSANKFNYSNSNYMLLGMIAENATGFHISKLIRDSILTPINLDSTFYSYQEPVMGTIAHPWVSGVDDTTSRVSLNSASGAAGAIYSTAADMTKWYNALFSEQVVNSSSLAQMTTFLTGADQFGFGIQKRIVVGRTTWGHGGKGLGYLSEAFYDPITKVSAFGASNSDSASVAATTFLLLKTVADNLPDTAKPIVGTTTVCQGQNSVTYTVPIIARATSYTWILPNGAIGISQTNSITVTFGNNSASGNITVYGYNLYGDGRPATLAITVNTQPSSVITTSGATSFCSGGSVGLIAGFGSSYLWSNGATTQSINVANSGNYSVTVTGSNGCSATTAPTIITTVANATPTVSISTNANTICAGTNVVFTATPVNGGNVPSFQWKKNGNNVGNNSNAYADNNLANNDSIWCVLTSNSACVVTSSAISNKIKLTVNSLPEAVAAINGIKTSCSIGGTNNLSCATIGGVWISSNTSVATVNNTGKVTAISNGTSNITYTVTNANGCSSNISTSFIVAAVIVAPITGLNTVCVGASVQLSNVTPNGFWSSLNNRASIGATGLLTGLNGGGSAANIKYTVTNANGCSAFAIYAVTVNPIPGVPSIIYAPGTPNPQAGAPIGNFCVGKVFTVVGTPNVPTGTWSSTGIVSITSGGVVTINSVGAGSIKYTYTSAAGCSNSRTMIGNGYTCAARGVSVNGDAIVASNDFTTYPNPAKSILNLYVEPFVGTGSIIINNLYGKTVKNQPLSMGTNTVDIANLSKGMYFVSIVTNEGKITKKLVLE